MKAIYDFAYDRYRQYIPFNDVSIVIDIYYTVTEIAPLFILYLAKCGF